MEVLGAGAGGPWLGLAGSRYGARKWVCFGERAVT